MRAIYMDREKKGIEIENEKGKAEKSKKALPSLADSTFAYLGEITIQSAV